MFKDNYKLSILDDIHKTLTLNNRYKPNLLDVKLASVIAVLIMNSNKEFLKDSLIEDSSKYRSYLLDEYPELVKYI